MQKLADKIDIEWPGGYKAELELKYLLPKIWTQKNSRKFGIYWSEELKYGTLRPEPSDEELDAFYNIENYDDYLSGKERKTGNSSSIADRIIAKIAWKFDKSELPAKDFAIAILNGSERVCDVGCGSGAFLQALKPYCGSVTGIDPSKISIDSLASNEIEGFLGSAEFLPKEILNKKFDLIAMQQSLEHCRDPVLALKNLRDICAPTGKLLIEVPNHECFGFAKYGPAWFHTDAGRHIHFFSAKSLTELLASTGWQAVEASYLSFSRQFSRDWISSMQDVWDSLYDTQSNGVTQRPRQLDRITDLFSCAWRSRAERYDVIRVFCSPK